MPDVHTITPLDPKNRIIAARFLSLASHTGMPSWEPEPQRYVVARLANTLPDAELDVLAGLLDQVREHAVTEYAERVGD